MKKFFKLIFSVCVAFCLFGVMGCFSAINDGVDGPMFGEDEGGTISSVRGVNLDIGDVLFYDGTCMKVEDVKTGVPDSKVDRAMAVVAAITEDGRILGVGIHKHIAPHWAKSSTFGETNSFEGIITRDHRHGDEIEFEGDLDGSDNWDYICKIDSEGTADARQNYPVFYYANTYGENYNLSGTAYEKGWYLPAVNELYEIAHKNRAVVQKSLSAVGGFYFDTGYYLTSSQHYSNPLGVWDVGIDRDAIDIFAKHCTSCCAVFVREFSGKSFYKYNRKVSFPKITSVEIPVAGEGYTGEIPVRIVGKNLKGSDIKCSDSSFGNVKIVTSSLVTATIVCDGIVGKKSITVSVGSANSKASVNVVSAEKCYGVGDVLFVDGSCVKAKDVNSNILVENTSKPYGVVAAVPYGGGIAKVIGLQKSNEDENKKWCNYETVGYNSSFPEICSDYNGFNSIGFTFYGDLDGSDNWSYICSIDPEGSADAGVNYPVFAFANSYGVNAGLEGTKYESGWYVPTVKELYDVYCNKDVVQKSLDAVGGFVLLPSERPSEYFYEYWSSSTLSSVVHKASYVNFVVSTSNNISSEGKTTSKNVLVMQTVKVE